jgi:hypothetical protein
MIIMIDEMMTKVFTLITGLRTGQRHLTIYMLERVRADLLEYLLPALNKDARQKRVPRLHHLAVPFATDLR